MSYPQDYPDVTPDLDLSLTPSSLPPHLLTFPNDKIQLLDSLAATMEEKMTGKELWEKGMFGKIEEEDDTGEAGELDALERLKV